jgi:hypothetical protein
LICRGSISISPEKNAVRTAAASVLALFLATGTAFAQDTDATVPPQSRASEESLHHLLDVMQSRKIVETMSQQVDSMYTGLVNKMLEGKTLTDEQQQAIRQRREEALGLFKQLFSWDSMETLYLKVYGDTFTQAEIDSMTAFYSSPTGQAVITKLPQAMKVSMSEMQNRMATILPKIQQMAKETAEQIKAQDTAAKRKAG